MQKEKQNGWFGLGTLFSISPKKNSQSPVPVVPIHGKPLLEQELVTLNPTDDEESSLLPSGHSPTNQSSFLTIPRGRPKSSKEKASADEEQEMVAFRFLG